MILRPTGTGLRFRLGKVKDGIEIATGELEQTCILYIIILMFFLSEKKASALHVNMHKTESIGLLLVTQILIEGEDEF